MMRRLFQEVLLPILSADHPAELLVLVVVGAQDVAVQQQDGLPI